MAQQEIHDTHDFEGNGPIVLAALQSAFPGALIDLEPGYRGRIRVKMVGRTFNGMAEQEKQTAVWDVLREKLHDGAQAISYVVVYGTDEL